MLLVLCGSHVEGTSVLWRSVQQFYLVFEIMPPGRVKALVNAVKVVWMRKELCWSKNVRNHVEVLYR